MSSNNPQKIEVIRIGLILVVSLLLFAFSACGQSKDSNSTGPDKSQPGESSDVAETDGDTVSSRDAEEDLSGADSETDETRSPEDTTQNCSEQREAGQSCCPDLGENACSGDMLCSDLGDENGYKCYELHSREDGQSCSEDSLCDWGDICFEGTCNEDKCRTAYHCNESGNAICEENDCKQYKHNTLSCSSDDECQSLHCVNGTCQDCPEGKILFGLHFGRQDWSCAKPCDSASDCPEDFDCMERISPQPDKKVCIQRGCDSNSDCKEGWRCEGIRSMGNFCVGHEKTTLQDSN